MKRRNFFSILGASLGFLLVGGKEKVTVNLKRSSIILSLCKCQVAGFQYYQGPQIYSSLQAGQPLKLLREPDNPYDSKAIAIFTQTGNKLGYVPRTINTVPSGLMDGGQELKARLLSVAIETHNFDPLIMEIFMVQPNQEIC